MELARKLEIPHRLELELELVALGPMTFRTEGRNGAKDDRYWLLGPPEGPGKEPSSIVKVMAVLVRLNLERWMEDTANTAMGVVVASPLGCSAVGWWLLRRWWYGGCFAGNVRLAPPSVKNPR
ncbi:Uncharacterized protein Fot_39206 [Forsythia ovata]|uniref:Uncharacterized protein n=1 Tax=Forsythia ovata TaxID=205694 RepID=A0ABD1S5J2_9LAMI